MKGMLMIFAIMVLGVLATEKLTTDCYTTNAVSYKTWDYDNDQWGDWQKPDKAKFDVEVDNDSEGVILIKSQPVQYFYFKSRILGRVNSNGTTYDEYECKDSDGNEILIQLFYHDRGRYALQINDFSNAIVGMYTMRLE